MHARFLPLCFRVAPLPSSYRHLQAQVRSPPLPFISGRPGSPRSPPTIRYAGTVAFVSEARNSCSNRTVRAFMTFFVVANYLHCSLSCSVTSLLFLAPTLLSLSSLLVTTLCTCIAIRSSPKNCLWRAAKAALGFPLPPTESPRRGRCNSGFRG